VGDCGVILVIDHDREFRLLAEDVLGRMNHPSRAVAGAEEALAFLDGDRPALVVIEVELPELSGLAILAQLLETFGEDLPVILTSAERGTPLDRAAGILLGADDYLVKPIDPAELVARVRRSLRRSGSLAATANGNGNGNGNGHKHVEASLSPRELEILELLAEGQSQREIAATLVISPKTVGTHIQHVLAKLGVHSRAQAIAAAYSRGLVGSDVVAHELTLGPLPA
jgi:two-component system nitrate/nitrite response regulator NarL